VFAISAGVSMANLGGGPSEQAYTFGIMSTGATDVVVGVVASVSYDEDVDAAVLGRKQDTLGYKMSFLPRRVFRGSILPYGKRKDKGESGAITVHYRDMSPFFFSDSAKVLFRPEVGLTYLLFLTPRKATDAFDLADNRFGILLVLPALLWDEAEQKDEWGLLVGTLESGDIPRYFHDTLFDFLIHCDDISEERKMQLRKINKEYYKQQLVIIQRIVKENE